LRADAFGALRGAGLCALAFAACLGVSNRSRCREGFFLVADLAMRSLKWGQGDSSASYYAMTVVAACLNETLEHAA